MTDEELKERFKQILEEQRSAGDSGKKYEKHLNEATERALTRMQGKEGREL
jgi:uncharacterized protein YbjQ (UPF0145 family)